MIFLQVRCIVAKLSHMHRILQDVLWLAPAVLEFVIVVSMFKRGLAREYPVFWSYLVFIILRTVLLFGIGNDRSHYAKYFYAYWITEVISCLLGFFVLAEIFSKAFAKRLGLQKYGTAIFRFTLIALIAAAPLVASLSTGSDSSKVMAAMVSLKRAESLVQAGLVAALFVFVFVLGLPCASSTIGIAAGFAIQGAAEIAAWAARAHYGRMANRAVTWSVLTAGFCQVLVWAAYLLRRQSAFVGRSAFEETSNNLSTATAELERINEQVGILLERRC